MYCVITAGFAGITVIGEEVSNDMMMIIRHRGALSHHCIGLVVLQS